MDFFKVVANGHLMDMEEVESSPSDDLVPEDHTTISNPGAGGEDKDEK